MVNGLVGVETVPPPASSGNPTENLLNSQSPEVLLCNSEEAAESSTFTFSILAALRLVGFPFLSRPMYSTTVSLASYIIIGNFFDDHTSRPLPYAIPKKGRSSRREHERALQASEAVTNAVLVTEVSPLNRQRVLNFKLRHEVVLRV